MKNRFIKNILFASAKITTPFLSNTGFSRLLFRINCFRFHKPYYKLNISKPRTFNEKITFLKFNSRNPLSPIVADKYLVRNYVAERIGAKYLIPLIAKFDSPDEIDLTNVEGDVIVKMNTGSGNNFIIKANQEYNLSIIKNSFRGFFFNDPYAYSREWHYKKMAPCIIVEKLIGENLIDYKFFCNENGPYAIQVDVDRYIDHKRNLYDLNWNLLPYKLHHDNTTEILECPKNLPEMIELAKMLSRGFIFSRIDLYEFEGRVWFGEITMHPGGGAEPFDSFESDLLFGKEILLEHI